MIRGEPRFAWLWPPEAWRERARALERSRQGDWQRAQRLVERAITKGARDRFLQAVTDRINDQLLPELATVLQTSLPEDTTERRILRAMARRDFFYTWLVSPNWRARLSYQQLVQSRTWATRIASGADLLAQPFGQQVCAVEAWLKAQATAAIAAQFNPALIDRIEDLTRELGRSEGRLPYGDRQALATYFLFERLRDTILETVVAHYDGLVR